MPDHKAATGAELHEPKYVSTAAANRVIQANGTAVVIPTLPSPFRTFVHRTVHAPSSSLGGGRANWTFSSPLNTYDITLVNMWFIAPVDSGVTGNLTIDVSHTIDGTIGSLTNYAWTEAEVVQIITNGTSLITGSRRFEFDMTEGAASANTHHGFTLELEYSVEP